MAARILLKTTIGPVEDGWNVARFSLLANHLAALKDELGRALYAVTAANRIETRSGDDADLQAMAAGEYDQLWLFAVDATAAFSEADAGRIALFRERGGSIFLTRGHADLGVCLTRLGEIGATQHFHSVNPQPDETWRCNDDAATSSIGWPNYNTGADGDLQIIESTPPLHPIMQGPSGAPIRRLPAHPHEGVVGVPDALAAFARVVARGRCKTTGASFNLCVAVDEPRLGRVVSDSNFHHFCDYNWDPRRGCPSFVNELPGDTVLREPDALADTRTYVENIAAWLDGRI